MFLPFHQRRQSALGLVILSGVALLLISLPLQVAAWELRVLLQARFGWTDSELPNITRWFVSLFGYRPDCYLTFVVWWFFWPIAGSLSYCHLTYANSVEFSLAFLNAFIYCWMIFFCFVCMVLMICSMPFVILLAEFHEAPRIATAIEPISWILPIAAAAACVGLWRRNRRYNFTSRDGE